MCTADSAPPPAFGGQDPAFGGRLEGLKRQPSMVTPGLRMEEVCRVLTAGINGPLGFHGSMPTGQVGGPVIHEPALVRGPPTNFFGVGR